MPELGKKIRGVYKNIINETTLIYLIINNAGGHGTKDCIEEHIKMLKKDHNIIVKHQVPWSPETNLLDLGIWSSLQSLVEKTYLGQRSDKLSLDENVQKAWNNYMSADIFKKVFDRWKKVLQIIIDDKGGNKNIDNHRKNFLQTKMIDNLLI